LFSDAGHEIATSVLATFVTVTLCSSVGVRGLIDQAYRPAGPPDIEKLKRHTSLGTRPAKTCRITLWPRSAVGANISGQPPSITVMPCRRP